jgi:integrase
MGVRVKFHKGAWWIFIHHEGRRRAKKIGDRDAAKRIAQQVRERLAGEELHLPRMDGETLEQYASAWLECASGNLKASTVRFYRDNLRRHILPLLGTRSLGAISRSDARDLIASLRKKGLKLNTIKGIARTLSTVLSQAVEDDRIAANPALRMGRYLRRGDELKRQIEPLTRAEARHLVSVAQRDFPRWSPWILCALRTGMRLGELNALQWGDIDWNGRFIVVRRNLVRGVLTSPKSQRERKVDLSLQLRDALARWQRVLATRWLKKGQPMPDWVFPSREGTTLEERNVRHVFTRVLKRAGLRQIRIHDLRQHAGSRIMPGSVKSGRCHAGGHQFGPCRFGIIRLMSSPRLVGREGRRHAGARHCEARHDSGTGDHRLVR